jgi:hypothetical protein
MPGRQVIAHRVVIEHGMDPDPRAVSGGAVQLEIPSWGSPLPREP